MPDLAKMRTLWTSGAAVLFMAAVSLGGTWFFLTAGISLVLEVIGISASRVGWWVAVAAPLWAPLAFGLMLRSLPHSLMQGVWMAGLGAPRSR